MTSSIYPSGSLWTLRRVEEDPLAFLRTLAESRETVIPFRLGTRSSFFLNHPSAIEDVFVLHPEKFVKGPGFARAKRLLGDGLLTASGSLHPERRRIAQPAFARQRMAAYVPTVVAHAARLRDGWQARHTIDIEGEMRSLTLAIAGETLFGTDLTGTADEIARAVAGAVSPMDGLLSLVASLRQVRSSRRRLDAIIDDIVDKRTRSGRAGDDLLALLLERCELHDSASVRQLRDDAVTFLLAGHDTIAHGLTWTWVLLAGHAEAEARLHAELASVIGTREPTADDLQRLPYTRSVLAEALRLRPPAWVIVRQAAEEHQCGDTQIPRGSLVVASPFVTHRDARFFPDPLTFAPERWLLPEPRPRLAYFPFGAGPRSCIGEGFAWMEGTLALATLAARWRLTLDERTVHASPRITLRPRGPVPMTPTLSSG